MMGGEHDFRSASTRIARSRIDDEKAELSGMGAAIEVCHRHGVAGYQRVPEGLGVKL